MKGPGGRSHARQSGRAAVGRDARQAEQSAFSNVPSGVPAPMNPESPRLQAAAQTGDGHQRPKPANPGSRLAKQAPTVPIRPHGKRNQCDDNVGRWRTRSSSKYVRVRVILVTFQIPSFAFRPPAPERVGLSAAQFHSRRPAGLRPGVQSVQYEYGTSTVV